MRMNHKGIVDQIPLDVVEENEVHVVDSSAYSIMGLTRILIVISVTAITVVFCICLDVCRKRRRRESRRPNERTPLLNIAGLPESSAVRNTQLASRDILDKSRDRVNGKRESRLRCHYIRHYPYHRKQSAHIVVNLGTGKHSNKRKNCSSCHQANGGSKSDFKRSYVNLKKHRYVCCRDNVNAAETTMLRDTSYSITCEKTFYDKESQILDNESS